METRKLQEVGGGTYTVSIPKEWADEHQFEAGRRVHLYTHADGSIVVRSGERDGGNLDCARVDVGGESAERVERALRAVHAAGFETARLVPDASFTDAQRRAARRTARRLVGAELLVEREDEVRVRYLLAADDVSVRQSVVQLQFVARSVHRAGVQAFVSGEDATDRVRERRAEAVRLHGIVTRHLSRALRSLAEVDRLDATRAALFDYHEAGRLLGAVADRGVELARQGERLATPLPEAAAARTQSTAAAMREAVDDAATAVLEEDGTATAHAALAAHETAVAGVDDVVERLESAGGPPATRGADSLARTADHGGALVAVASRAAVRRANL